jgi:putative membrane protein
MAGMLVYPRYKLHQLSSSPGDELFETMKSASKKLKMIILNPSIILVWIFGVTMMVMNTALLQNGWFHVKLLAVLILTGLHGYFVMLGRKIDAGQDVSSKQLKMMNEVPFLLFIIAAVMVIVRPF